MCTSPTWNPGGCTWGNRGWVAYICCEKINRISLCPLFFIDDFKVIFLSSSIPLSPSTPLLHPITMSKRHAGEDEAGHGVDISDADMENLQKIIKGEHKRRACTRDAEFDFRWDLNRAGPPGNHSR